MIMQTMRIDQIEQNSFHPEKLDFPDKIAFFNKSFSTSVRPENGIIGFTEIVKDNGWVERLSRNELGHARKEYFQNGILIKCREKVNDTTWTTTRFDDNGTAYLTEYIGKNTNGMLTVAEMKLTPGVEIKKGNFTVKIDNHGRPISNKITNLELCPGRENLSNKLRDASYRETDQRGHIIADKFGGPASKENVVPQMEKTNTSSMKKLENEVTRLKNEGHTVDYEVKTNYSGNDARPTSFEPVITVDGKPYTDLPSELKKIYNDDLSEAGKIFTTAKEHVNKVATKVSPFHEAGVKEGLSAAAITCAVSTVDNVVKFSEGEITAEEMVIDIAKDTGTAGVIGYGTGFVTQAVSVSMQNSTNTMLQSLGNVGVPAALVSFGVASYENVMDFAQGEIDGLELAYDLGENATSVAGASAGSALGLAAGGALVAAAGSALGAAGGGAAAGAAIGSVVPGAGTAVGFVVGGGLSLVGGMVGTAVATGAYHSAVELGTAGAEKLADKAHEVASGTIDVAKECMPEHVEEVRGAINAFLADNHMPFSV